MKTKNTCINCAMLNCGVRLECEDNECEMETKIQDNIENSITIQVIEPELIVEKER